MEAIQLLDLGLLDVLVSISLFVLIPLLLLLFRKKFNWLNYNIKDRILLILGKQSRGNSRVQKFKLKNFKPGIYTLQVKVTDWISEKSETRDISFIVTD